MSDNINLTNPKSNQILIYSQIEKKFINVEPTLDLFGYQSTQHSVYNSGDTGVGVLSRFNGTTLTAKKINVGKGLSITSDNNKIVIESDRNALTLNGFTSNDILLKENKLNDIDIGPLKERLNYYDKEQTHDKFMEGNASNIPDLDNAYDLGSNGKRYSDIYAYTFHGTATKAIMAEQINQYNAKKDQVLTWTEDGWRPRTISGRILNTFYMQDIIDVELKNDIAHNTILIYDTDKNKFVGKDFDDIESSFNLDIDKKINDLQDIYIKKEGLQILPQYGERVINSDNGNINSDSGNVHVLTFTEQTEITLTSPKNGRMYPLTIIMYGAEQHPPIWPENLRWIGGEIPEYQGNDIVTVFTIDGENWIASYIGSY